MTHHMLIDAQDPDETRVVVTNDKNDITHFDFVTKAKSQIKGNIFLAKITRVEPSLQAAFVEYGADKQGFLPFSEIHPDYYQIPVEDRKKLLEEAEHHNDTEEAEEEPPKKPSRRRGRRKKTDVTTSDVTTQTEEQSDTPKEIEQADNKKLDDTQKTESNEDTSSDNSTQDADLSKIKDNNQLQDSSKETSNQLDAHEDHTPEDAESVVSSSNDEKKEAQSEESELHSDENNKKPARKRGRRKTFSKTQPAKRSNKDDIVASEEASDEEQAPIDTDEDEVDEVRKKRPHLNRRYKIQEVIKPGQIILVQVIKEERGNKGVSLSSYISLAGRYCVLMPNSPKDGGISRKISTSDDRKRLKEISDELKALRGMSAIIRTAGTGRTRAEIKRDYEYLIKLWNQIREDALASMAPAVVYEENDIIKRSIRDHYNGEIERIFVQGEASYKQAKAFMKLLMPSHAPRVKHYKEAEPLFVAHNIERTIDSLYNPRAELPSGGYIIINPTEALISIDVNSGSSTNERNVEETAYKTNLEAARETARQLRLRNLGGLIVVDFIDMNYGKHRKNIEREMRNAMKDDRARTQVGHISSFGLMELSRQRMGASLEETTTQECIHCAGTGKVLHSDAIVIQLMRNLQAFVRDHAAPKITLQLSKEVAQSFFNQYRHMLADIENKHTIAFELDIIIDESAGIYCFDNHNGVTFHSADGIKTKNNHNRRNKNKRQPQHHNQQQKKNNNKQSVKSQHVQSSDQHNTSDHNDNGNDNDKTSAINKADTQTTVEDQPKRKPRRNRNRRAKDKNVQDDTLNATNSNEESDITTARPLEEDKTTNDKIDENKSLRKQSTVETSPLKEETSITPAKQEPATPQHDAEDTSPAASGPVAIAVEPKAEDTPAPKRKRKGWWQRVVEG